MSIRIADDSSLPFCYFNSSSLSAVANYDLRCIQFVDPACNDFRVLQLRWGNLNQNSKMKKRFKFYSYNHESNFQADLSWCYSSFNLFLILKVFYDLGRLRRPWRK